MFERVIRGKNNIGENNTVYSNWHDIDIILIVMALFLH